MKIKLSAIFSIMSFIIIVMSIVEAHGISGVQFETAIESVSELESFESELVADVADHVNTSTLMDRQYKDLSLSDDTFACLVVAQDLFRPPRLV